MNPASFSLPCLCKSLRFLWAFLVIPSFLVQMRSEEKPERVSMSKAQKRQVHLDLSRMIWDWLECCLVKWRKHTHIFAKSKKKIPQICFIFAICEHWQSNQQKRIFQGFFFFFSWYLERRKKLIAMQKMSKNGSHRVFTWLKVCEVDLLNLDFLSHDILEEKRELGSYRAGTSTDPLLWNKMLGKDFCKGLHGDTHPA